MRRSPTPRRPTPSRRRAGRRSRRHRAMAVTSAGILLYRLVQQRTEVLIAHMGGPYWAAKDAAAWSIPKGEYDPDAEAALDAALREFAEELGVAAPDGPYAELGTFAYSSGKRVTVFVADGADFVARRSGVRRVRAGVAAAVGAHAVLPRGRPRRVDRDGCRARASREGSASALDALERPREARRTWPSARCVEARRHGCPAAPAPRHVRPRRCRRAGGCSSPARPDR